MSSRFLPVPDGLEGMRVDAGLSRLLGISRTLAAEICATGGVLQDGAEVGKSDRLVAGSLLDVTLPDADRGALLDESPVDGMSLIYADDDIVVVDKPAGVAAHPSPGWDGPTVIGGVLAMGHRVSTSGAEERRGVVHRLDAGTTGLMVVAKSERAYTVLKQAFKQRTVEKVYHAIVQGHPDPTSGTIDAPIGRHPRHDWKFAVVAGGRDSITHYEVIEAFPSASLVEIHLETGRTHQIRVHFSALRHPCVGDAMYGADPSISARLDLQRQWLQAHRLAFAHPADGRWVSFQSPYPPDLQHALDVLRED
ncbi:RluA family pseudouridine synthase [Blastococcus sp. Marseille-P5729]|uniref:RluA family pseudouridine synthase n=1 Tax=Blastococcus sp. Marseille-P5729 TaxID=2086582 RepID=UPI000D0EE9EF|nr:RluA family pseudouridine synthase [Blastococcus sp. Marseille-P5729]